MPIQSTGFEGSLVISWNVGLSNRLTEKFKKTNCTYTRCKNPCLTITHVQESRGGCCDSCPRWGTNEMASSARRHQPHSTPGQPDHRCSSTLVRTLNQPLLEGNPADGCGSGKNMCHLLFLTLPLLPASPLEAGRSRYPCGNLLCTSGGPGDIFKISWCLLLCFQEGMPFPDTKQGWPGVSPALSGWWATETWHSHLPPRWKSGSAGWCEKTERAWFLLTSLSLQSSPSLPNQDCLCLRNKALLTHNVLFLEFNTACHKGTDRHYWNEQAGQANRGPEVRVSWKWVVRMQKTRGTTLYARALQTCSETRGQPWLGGDGVGILPLSVFKGI